MTSIRSLLPLAASLLAASSVAQEPVIGGPCEGCEWVYVDMPEQIPSSARIAPVDEPGEPLTLEGTVYSTGGEPVRDVVVYAYQTNAAGIYPAGTTRHGRLRAWTRTDARGRYRFDTIRPGAYPGRDEPEHIHMHVIEPGIGTYYIDSVTFTDDPLLTPAIASRAGDARGGSGRSTPVRDEDGAWLVRRDIRLGSNVPGYR